MENFLMTHNPAHENEDSPWFEDLADSVRALGDAAREWQLADRAASLAEAHVRMDRTVLHPGRTTHEPGPDTQPLYRRTLTRNQPHLNAVFDLQRLYADQRSRTRSGYRHAAKLYASGAAWAIARVQAGEEPRQIVFQLDQYERPEPMPHDYRIEGLEGLDSRYDQAGELRAAYERLVSMDVAFDVAEEIAGRPNNEVSENDANEMWKAGDHAAGLGDAAYAYGQLAEQALSFVLLGVREAWRKQQAADEEKAAQEERAAQAKRSAMVMAEAIRDAERYLQRGEPELAALRLQSDKPLPPCRAPWPGEDCARPVGHRGACSPEADYRDPAHDCPDLPDRLFAVARIDPEGICFDGVYEDGETAEYVASGHDNFHADQAVAAVDGTRRGSTRLNLTGGTPVVVIPLDLNDDPRAEDDYPHGMEDADPDYGRDLDDEDDHYDDEDDE